MFMIMLWIRAHDNVDISHEIIVPITRVAVTSLEQWTVWIATKVIFIKIRCSVYYWMIANSQSALYKSIGFAWISESRCLDCAMDLGTVPTGPVWRHSFSYRHIVIEVHVDIYDYDIDVSMSFIEDIIRDDRMRHGSLQQPRPIESIMFASTSDC